ncbi:MAG: nuclear transport factor 2 family protein [Bacteroidia bacterium]
MKPKFFLFASLIFLCHSFLQAQTLSSGDKTAIMAVFLDQEKAWNAGDVDRFMEGYWKSDSLTFIGSSGITYGWTQTRDNYKKRYPDRTAMGTLSFKILRLEKLDKNTAFLIGTFHLKREIGDLGGYFTLVWKKIKGKWVIVSDHTS